MDEAEQMASQPRETGEIPPRESREIEPPLQQPPEIPSWPETAGPKRPSQKPPKIEEIPPPESREIASPLQKPPEIPILPEIEGPKRPYQKPQKIEEIPPQESREIAAPLQPPLEIPILPETAGPKRPSQKPKQNEEPTPPESREIAPLQKPPILSKTTTGPKRPSRKLNFEEGEMVQENYIRREKHKQMETKKEIARMRANLPQYSLNEIRMHKLPFHEALMLQLEESGHENTKGYIEQLFALNESLRKDAGPMSVLWTRPMLRDSVPELKHLSDALMIAEDSHKKGEYKKENETILTLAVDLAFKFEGWFWLAKELVVQCISITNQYKKNGKHEAMARFIYAKMLIEKVRDYDVAEQQLNMVREMSTGKSWNMKNLLPDMESYNTLFMNVNRLLYECCMRNAHINSKINWNKALEYAILAKRRAIEACFYEGETRAFYFKGQCELNLGNYKDAVSTFSKAYHVQKRLKSPDGICEALMELSKAYLMRGSTQLALKTLTELKALAEEHGFRFYLAQALRYLGEYYLNCGLPEKASPLLVEALEMFNETERPGEADQVRNLGALSSGLELMPVFVPLLQRTDRRCADWYENLQKIVRWKDSREAFWVVGEAEAACAGLGALAQLDLDEVCTKVRQPEDDCITELASIFEEKPVDAVQTTEDLLKDDS